MTFTGTDSCGNSPKNVFVATFEENLFNGDKEALAEVIADDCVLQLVHPPSPRRPTDPLSRRLRPPRLTV